MSEDGIKEIKLHLPQISMKRVDISFDYPRCSKKYKKITPWLKIPYPHCTKNRKVIKFDVPNVTWDMTSIKLPLIKDSKEIIKNIEGAIKALKDILEAIKLDFAEAEDMFRAQLEVANKYNSSPAISQIEEELEDLLAERDKTVREIEDQIAELEKEISQV